ncbi:hypothetical protein, partial [Burkholderia ambifaria]|uniref:hypothetical protein n=1 Tax=Burkholderia ambifaria TaxID=152480 RepID=UPI001ABAE1B4
IAASGAGHPAAVQLTRHESGHFYVAKSGHFNLAITTQSGDNSRYVKYEIDRLRPPLIGGRSIPPSQA